MRARPPNKGLMPTQHGLAQRANAAPLLRPKSLSCVEHLSVLAHKLLGDDEELSKL